MKKAKSVNQKRSALSFLLKGGRLLGFAAITFGVIQSGCTRTHYRLKADEETYALIEEKTAGSQDGSIQRIDLDPRSRMFDPFNPDRPPMPEDDPDSHRYMEFIDKKKHYPLWDVNGRTNTVENPVWWQYLPLNEDGVLVMDADTAVRLAILHNQNYQSEVETLYLSAIDVSSERFLFDNQFFGGYSTDFAVSGKDRAGNGGNSRSNLAVGPFSRGRRPMSWQRRFSTGADMVVGLANSITWQLSGPDTQSASTLLDFSFIQPLLRQGGRDVVLERLTLAERTLLYNVRSFERYRRGFYCQVAIGRAADAGPTRRGGLFGGAGLEGFTGLGGGFGRVGNTNAAGAGFANAQAVPRAGGYLGLLQSQLEIRNAEENIARQRDILLAFEDTLRELLTTVPATQNTIPSQQLQVAQTRQSLIASQAALLQTRTNYEQTLDTFKSLLGIPPYICVEISDPLLGQFDLISNDLRGRRNEIANMREIIGQENSKLLAISKSAQDEKTGETYREIGLTQEVKAELKNIASNVEEISAIRRVVLDRDIETLKGDLKRLADSKDRRKTQLVALRERFMAEKQMVCTLLPTGSLDPALFDSTELDTLAATLAKDLDRINKRFDNYKEPIDKLKLDIQDLIEKEQKGTPREIFAALRDRVVLKIQTILSSFAEDVLALQVVQARARTESIVLPEVDLTPREAVEIARTQRVDWANQKAGLVDSWRAIEVVADDLESSLDVIFSGDVGNINDNPLSLKGSTGRLRAGLQWDAPITRLQERNRYRQALIEYQQAKRAYYQFEDNVWTTLRGQLRALHQNQLNFELQRYAVRIAASQILLNEDIRQINEALSQASGPTAARDSVSALNDLLQAQNLFLGVWVFYEAQRRNLDMDLGTMQLDGEGLWIDPGVIAPGRFYEQQPIQDPSALQQLPITIQQEERGMRRPEPAESPRPAVRAASPVTNP